MSDRWRIGLLVNPYAGLGGPLALKGSDGCAVQALQAGALPQAAARATQAILALQPWWPQINWLTGSGPLGEAVLAALGLPAQCCHHAQPAGGLQSQAEDSRQLAARLAAQSPDLLLFAGGDGTARDVLSGAGVQQAVLGIPAGVKMQSAVFGHTPQASGLLAARFLSGCRRVTAQQEVMDLDEAALRQGRVQAALFGYMATPVDPRYLQAGKSRAPEGDRVQTEAIAARVQEQLSPGVAHLFGPGSTTYAVKRLLGGGSLLGVDVWQDGHWRVQDATEAQLWQHVQQGPCQAWVSCIGGQGHVFGRGNQQFSPRILQRLGPVAVTVLATPGKLQSLGGRPLLIDSGDPLLDAAFAGMARVWTGYRDEVRYRLRGEPPPADDAAQ